MKSSVSDMSLLYNMYLRSTGVCIDTRKLEKGNLFFALKGEKFDGNKFIKAALENGAIGVVTDNYSMTENKCGNIIHVENSLKTLQKLAAYHRDQLKIPIIGITGSNGKTTTKELLHAVLSTKYKAFATKGNFNNHIGVPLTVLDITDSIEIAIVEMGANHLEEIGFLCQLSKPTHGYITNIGKAHLEGFGSLDNIKKGKSELYRYLEKSKGAVFLQKNDDVLVDLVLNNQVVFDLLDQEKFEVLESFPKLKLKYEDRVIITNLTGSYNLSNIISAISIGLHFNVDLENVINALENYYPSNNRSQILKLGEVSYVLDSYNANPSSMKKSIENMLLGEPSNTILILGDMKELGKYEKEEHQDLISYVQENNWSDVFTVGDVFMSIKNNPFKRFKTVELLKSFIKEYPIRSKYVLLKGSRSIGLEKLLK